MDSPQNFASQIREKFGIDFWLSSAHQGEPPLVSLDSIRVPPERQGEGVGKIVMSSLIDWADSNGFVIALTPSSGFGGKLSSLREFYSKFGFVPNTGKIKDFRTRETFIRYPKKSMRLDEMWKKIKELNKK